MSERRPIANMRAAPPESRRAASPPSDLEILAGLHQGEQWAADELYDRTHMYVERTLRRILRFHRAEQDDLMQAAFERMMRFLSERSLSGACNLPAWSSAVTANVALDYLRKSTRENRLFEREAGAIEARALDASPERMAEARAAAARVQRLLGRMKPKYAETLVLHDVLGHDLHEIAEIMGASVAATQSRLVRGRKELLRRAKDRR